MSICHNFLGQKEPGTRASFGTSLALPDSARQIKLRPAPAESVTSHHRHVRTLILNRMAGIYGTYGTTYFSSVQLTKLRFTRCMCQCVSFHVHDSRHAGVTVLSLGLCAVICFVTRIKTTVPHVWATECARAEDAQLTGLTRYVTRSIVHYAH